MTKIIELDKETVDEIEKATKAPFIYALANPDGLDGKVVLLVPPNATVVHKSPSTSTITEETIQTVIPAPSLENNVATTTCKWVKIGGDLYYICK